MVKHNEMAMQTLAGLPTNMPVARVEFDYDYMSRRVGKTVYEWGSNGWQEVSSATFLYDAWNLISEQTHKQTSAETNFFTFGLDLSGTLQGAGGIGGLVSAVLGTNAVCYTYDANGNVSELINCAGGANLSHYEYSPFGETIVATGELAKDNPFRFSTKYTDDETSLVYYGYRYYSPGMGRWINRDPIGEDGGVVQFSLAHIKLKILRTLIGFDMCYLFVHNSVIDMIDVNGLWRWWGNWGGPDWTGGNEASWDGLTDEAKEQCAPPIDPQDECYMHHDICYGTCRQCDNNEEARCFKQCDRALAGCLRKLPPEHKNWRSRCAWLYFRISRPFT